MSRVLNKTTLNYLESVNTPDYPESDWIINPDMSGVEGVDRKYWKLVNDVPTEMTAQEKQAVDDAELQSRKDAIQELGDTGLKEVMTALIKVLNSKLPANKQITKQELITAIKEEII